MTKRVELACPAGSLPALPQLKRVIGNGGGGVAAVAFASLYVMAERRTHSIGAFDRAWP